MEVQGRVRDGYLQSRDVSATENPCRQLGIRVGNWKSSVGGGRRGFGAKARTGAVTCASVGRELAFRNVEDIPKKRGADTRPLKKSRCRHDSQRLSGGPPLGRDILGRHLPFFETHKCDTEAQSELHPRCRGCICDARAGVGLRNEAVIRPDC